ncbi:hypothetical protein [Vibrio nigripulchritudo]|uniref:hypothetical protein n=1 Tax=Vibrio nigripulchritudo TaxID=28173 RepID=UPI0005F9C84E|nr:hypothetical protein [Vibrio nigripulchritudo]KJY78709.1 hypothetical protein TW74_11690 [Vibrio nigripulchritudo]
MRTLAVLLFSLLLTFSQSAFAQAEVSGYPSQSHQIEIQLGDESPSSIDVSQSGDFDSHSKRIPEGLIASSRVVSWAQERVFPTPDYELIAQLGGEDRPPSYLFFTLSIPSVLWSEKAVGSNPHRVSGWKDSNQLYVQLNQRS